MWNVRQEHKNQAAIQQQEQRVGQGECGCSCSQHWMTDWLWLRLLKGSEKILFQVHILLYLNSFPDLQIHKPSSPFTLHGTLGRWVSDVQTRGQTTIINKNHHHSHQNCNLQVELSSDSSQGIFVFPWIYTCASSSSSAYLSPCDNIINIINFMIHLQCTSTHSVCQFLRCLVARSFESLSRAPQLVVVLLIFAPSHGESITL